MRRKILWCIALFAALFVAPAWSHHAAEGIVSDDIWQMIDDQLASVDSPHLNIDFDDVMGSMRVGEDADRGSLFLETSIVVHMEDVPDYLLVVEMAMDEILAEMAEAGQLPRGVINSGRSNTLRYEVNDLGDGIAEIVLYEPIGALAGSNGKYPGKKH